MGMESRKDILNIGDRIAIVRLTSKCEKSYPSQVLDISTEGTLVVSGPIYKNKLVMIHRNEKVKVSYIIENKGRYAFDAIILRREYKGIYKLELKRISNIKKYQQRRFYRFNISIPVTKEFATKKETIIEECRTKNISGNGLKLHSNINHSMGDAIRCKFQIDNHLIDVKGKVVRIEKIDTFDYEYGLGINFIGLNEKDRDKIIKFIFKEERILREKELI